MCGAGIFPIFRHSHKVKLGSTFSHFLASHATLSNFFIKCISILFGAPRALPIFPLDQFIFGQLRPHPTPPRSVHPPKFDFVFSSHQLLVDLAAPRRELNSLALLNWLLTVSANSILIGSGQSVAGDRRTTAGFHHFCCTFCKAVSSWKETFNYKLDAGAGCRIIH